MDFSFSKNHELETRWHSRHLKFEYKQTLLYEVLYLDQFNYLTLPSHKCTSGLLLNLYCNSLTMHVYCGFEADGGLTVDCRYKRIDPQAESFYKSQCLSDVLICCLGYVGFLIVKLNAMSHIITKYDIFWLFKSAKLKSPNKICSLKRVCKDEITHCTPKLYFAVARSLLSRSCREQRPQAWFKEYLVV